MPSLGLDAGESVSAGRCARVNGALSARKGLVTAPIGNGARRQSFPATGALAKTFLSKAFTADVAALPIGSTPNAISSVFSSE